MTSLQVIEEQQEAMKNVLALAEKQRKIINLLSAKLEQLGHGDFLDKRSVAAPTTASGHEKLRYQSNLVSWNGTESGIVTLSIGGKRYSAYILSDEVVRLWNRRLDIRLKISKYAQELSKERDQCIEYQKKIDNNNKKVEDGEAIDVEQDDWWRGFLEGAQSRHATILKGQNENEDQEQSLERKLCRRIRAVLESTEQRKKEDPAYYLLHLKETLRAKYDKNDSRYDNIDIADRSEVDDLSGVSDTDESGKPLPKGSHARHYSP